MLNYYRKTIRITSGITLIALVVTIVVLLILAGITISLVFSENGIIAKAREAAEKTNQAVINGTPNGDTGLGLSNQDAFIERTEGTNGGITTATSIQPYQTYWYKDGTFMSTAFKDYTKQDSSTEN